MTMRLVSRRGWSARAATYVTPLPMADLKGIAVHYSGNLADEVNHSQCAKHVRSIQDYHMTRNAADPTKPWNDIAYSFLICKHGYVFEGRGWNVRTAANGTNDGNDHYMAFCFLGGDKVGRDDVLPVGRAALGDLIIEGEKRANRKLDIRPHSYFFQTGCPGDELRGWIKLHGWEYEPTPHPLPNWWWRWEAWRLRGEKGKRPKGVPKLIPPWAWIRAKQFEKNRKH